MKRMKKWMLLIAVFSSVIVSDAQVIPLLEKDYVVLENGEKQEGRINTEDKKYVYFRKSGAKKMVQLKKSSLQSWQDYDSELYNVPFVYPSEGQVAYSEVVQIDSTMKEELYSRAKFWFVDVFRDAQEVIQMEDEENGLIIGKGNSKLSYYDYRINFTAKIQVKDGRYKYSIYDIYVVVPISQYSDGQPIPLAQSFPEGEEIKGKGLGVKARIDLKKSILIELQSLCNLVKSGMEIPYSPDEKW